MSEPADRDAVPSVDAVIDDLLIVTREALQEARRSLSPQPGQADQRAAAAQFIIDKAPALIAALQELRTHRK